MSDPSRGPWEQLDYAQTMKAHEIIGEAMEDLLYRLVDNLGIDGDHADALIGEWRP